MTLRKKIENAIAGAKGDADSAATAVCLLLEYEVGLDSDGWFDDDPELQALYANEEKDAVDA